MNLHRVIPVLALSTALVSSSAFAYSDGSGYSSKVVNLSNVAWQTSAAPNWQSTRGYAAVGLTVTLAVSGGLAFGAAGFAASVVAIGAAFQYGGDSLHAPAPKVSQEGW